MANDLQETVRKAFLNATFITFEKMIMVSLEQKPEADIDQSLFEISGIIGFSGGITGNCALRLTGSAAKDVACRISGETVESATEISDGIGEFVNMIAGNAKAVLSEFNVSLSFPEVIRGKGHEIGFHRHTDILTLGFTSELGDMIVIVAYTDPAKADK